MSTLQTISAHVKIYGNAETVRLKFETEELPGKVRRRIDKHLKSGWVTIDVEIPALDFKTTHTFGLKHPVKGAAGR